MEQSTDRLPNLPGLAFPISGRIAKDVFAEMLETGQQAADIVEEKGLRQVSETGEIEAIIDKVIAYSPEQLAAYKAGKENLFGGRLHYDHGPTERLRA